LGKERVMEDLELTPEQEKIMLDTWNATPASPPSLAALSKAVFGVELDGRTKEVRAIKKCLARHNLKSKAATVYEPVGAIELTDEQKEYITNNAANMNALEMAKILFKTQNLTNLNSETRAVNDFVKTLDTKVIYSQKDVEDVPVTDYIPPNTLDKSLRKVNEYVNCGYDKARLNAIQKKGLEQLIGYLHTYRFIKQMNNYESEGDRKSCEDAFIRYTYDKPDLSQEEVDQYIQLSNEVVMGIKTQRRKEKLESMMERLSNNDTNGAELSMKLAEMIGKISTEYNLCIKRQQDYLDDLKEKRSHRLSKQIKDNASVLNIIHEWKQEEFRKRYLKIAEREQEAVAKELEKIDSIENIKARIFGLTRDEVLHG
jgi:hypothetical protein